MSGQSEAEMMRDALERARRLLRELEKQRDEVEANPPDIPPEQLAVGRMAMNNAIASARRMLQALTEAEQIRQELPQDQLCDDQEQIDQQTEADSGIQDESE
jgi:hypothetical protein